MKKLILFGAVAAMLSFAVALGAKSYRSTTHNTLFYANLEAMADPEGGGTDPGEGGIVPGGVICTTYTSYVYEEICYNPETGSDQVCFRSEQRSCNSGWLSWCYPGEIGYQFDWWGNTSLAYDNTYMTTCN